MKIVKYIFLGIVLISFYSCYTLSGSSLNPEIKTATIATFPNYSALQNPTLSQDFTIALQDRFDQRTNLNFVSQEGDINIEGEIKNYRVTPVNVQTGDVAAQNRLTVDISVRYDNKIEPDKKFDRVFSDYADFDANQTLEQVQDDLLEEIYIRIIDQIFNSIVSDW